MLELAICLISLAFGFQQPVSKDEIGKLSFLIGNWTSVEEFRPPTGDPIKFTLKGKNDWAMGGSAVRIEESFEVPGRGTRHNLILITYDANEKCYWAYWFQNMGPRPLVFKGQWNDKSLVLTSEPDPKRTGPTLRVTYAPKNDNEFDATLESQGEKGFEVRTIAKYTKTG